ncbi:MAG: zincin-like metallopeptidase domain-containing protein, partial [Nostoc sp. CmiVER01]|uniref:zincin-like metallopeptidase domain-containing protein n=1 Tax=Nostoc sp. CmiVER01 TaxID=3075384 RepID=UPI003D160AE6
EIASMIVGDELGIGHDPGQHAAYVGSWIKALQDEPLEVFRAAADAEKIHDYVLAFEQKQVQEQDQQQGQAQDEAVAQALAVDIAEVLDNPDVTFSHYQAFQGDTLEDALRSRGLETVGSITGTDPEQFYAVAHDRLSPVFGIDPSHTDTDNAYLERKGLAQEFANMAEQLHLAQQLQQHGEQIVSRMDAEARWSDGQRIFAFHDQDGEPHQVRTLDELNNYAPDQLMSLPALTQQQAAVADQEANMTPPTNDQVAALLAAHPADAVQGIEQAAAARRQLAAGKIDGQAFADATRQHLGVELPPDWSGELRIVGVAEQDGQTVDAAQAGI